ncbi:MAG: ion channel protein Tsx [Gammaproteobacteria bacterium (ex Lamellibrachia satsuma)]|nr:MAG: ion channel protein Tsx [Gammaproteobacteria bacterium (ex Lamellibrachia satsuma)]
MHKSRDYLFDVILLTGFIATPAFAGINNLFNVNAVTLQQGDGFEVGDSRRRILTLESASVWNWGDLYAFYDRAEGREGGDPSYYFEVSPRLSLGVLGIESRPPMIKDLLIATTFERGLGGFKAHLIGPGLTWDLPPFAHMETNLYYRDNPDLSGSTWQFTAAWVMPFELGSIGFLFDGYTDIRGSEGGVAPDLNFNPQLKLDAGRLFGYGEMIYAGFEYYHWNNKFGIDGVNERLLSPIVQVRISF